MIKNGIGGANTKTGLDFEDKVDLESLISANKHYKIKDTKYKYQEVFYKDEKIGMILKKYALYKYLGTVGVNWKEFLSKRLLPDSALYVIYKDTLNIIEVKSQAVEGSVDEKLQTCDFKRKQYQKLVSGLNLKVEYIYILNDWFKHPKYKDVLNYIESVNCQYYFNTIPLEKLGLKI